MCLIMSLVWCMVFFPVFFPVENSFSILTRNFVFLKNLMKMIFNVLTESNQSKYFTGFSLMFISLFFFIFLLNFFSLSGYIFSCTAHLVLNLGVGFTFWGFSMFMGFSKNFMKTAKHFVPENTPFLLISFLILIEILSVFMRPLVLAIRLTANLFAGHLLMCLISSIKLSFFGLILSSVVQMLFLGLEMMVSLIQAYIFSLLSMSYFGEIIN